MHVLHIISPYMYMYALCVIIVFSHYIVKKLYSYFRPPVILSLYVTSSDCVFFEMVVPIMLQLFSNC